MTLRGGRFPILNAKLTDEQKLAMITAIYDAYGGVRASVNGGLACPLGLTGITKNTCPAPNEVTQALTGDPNFYYRTKASEPHTDCFMEVENFMYEWDMQRIKARDLPRLFPITGSPQ